jgi:hypothetical protein
MKLTLAFLRKLADGNPQGSKPVIIAITANKQVLTCALEEALEFNVVRDSQPIVGEEYSIRLLLTHVRPGSPHAEELRGSEAAVEFLTLAAQDARYNPPKTQGQKGWKVEKILFQGKPAALVSATWVT